MARLPESWDMDMGLDPATQFEEIYRQEYKHILHFVSSLVPSEAEDITQETFLRAYKARDRYRPDAPVKYWLMTIARNTAISFTRKKARLELPLEDATEASYTADYAHVENTDLLHLMSVRLSNKQRMLLQSKFGDDLSNSETAKKNGVPLGTVGSAVYHAIYRMRKVAV